MGVLGVCVWEVPAPVWKWCVCMCVCACVCACGACSIPALCVLLLLTLLRRHIAEAGEVVGCWAVGEVEYCEPSGGPGGAPGCWAVVVGEALAGCGEVEEVVGRCELVGPGGV